MTRKYYFKTVIAEGEIYLQLKYYSPYDNNNNCYEGLFLLIDPNNNIRQFTENYNEVDFNRFRETFQYSDKGEFEKTQESKIFKCTRQSLYDKFYNDWKQYFLLRKKSVDTVRNSNPKNNWEYYTRLESEYLTNGVYVQKDTLIKMDDGIRQQNNPSLSDVFKEARHIATLDYSIGKI